MNIPKLDCWILHLQWIVEEKGQIEKEWKIQNLHILKFLKVPLFRIENSGSFRVTGKIHLSNFNPSNTTVQDRQPLSQEDLFHSWWKIYFDSYCWTSLNDIRLCISEQKSGIQGSFPPFSRKKSYIKNHKIVHQFWQKKTSEQILIAELFWCPKIVKTVFSIFLLARK